MAAKKRKPSRALPARRTKAEPSPFTASDFKRTHRTLPEQLEILHRVMSYREIARRIGVDQRTIRRWASDETKHPKLQEKVKAVRSGYDFVRKEAVHRAAEKPRRARLVGKRVYFIDPRDPERKRRIPGDSLDFDLLGRSRAVIISLLKKYRNNARIRGIPGITRFLVLADEDHPEYPEQYFWTEPFSLAEYTDADIENEIDVLSEDTTIILVRIQDR